MVKKELERRESLSSHNRNGRHCHLYCPTTAYKAKKRKEKKRQKPHLTLREHACVLYPAGPINSCLERCPIRPMPSSPPLVPRPLPNLCPEPVPCPHWLPWQGRGSRSTEFTQKRASPHPQSANGSLGKPRRTHPDPSLLVVLFRLAMLSSRRSCETLVLSTSQGCSDTRTKETRSRALVRLASTRLFRCSQASVIVSQVWAVPAGFPKRHWSGAAGWGPKKAPRSLKGLGS